MDATNQPHGQAGCEAAASRSALPVQVGRRRLIGALGLGTALAAGPLAGCGFKLRGPIEMPFRALYVMGGQSVLLTDIRRALTNAGGVHLVSRPEDADAILETLADTREKEILAFSSTGTPREYELRLRYRYRLLDKERDEWIPPSEIVLRRNVTTTDQQLLAKQQEDVLLFQEMQADLVQQLMHRLAAARP